MSKQLKARIEELRQDIAAADEDIRAELIEQLEQAVMLLEAKGDTAPAWAVAHVSARQEADEAVEDQFDNMPV
ncbi:MAG: hypothetical protein QNJ09_17320 [Paracoccaceae bacterium]|nr:hypothetical protein [Paracoccaceae bacterium]